MNLKLFFTTLLFVSTLGGSNCQMLAQTKTNKTRNASEIKLTQGPILLETEVAKIQIAFVDMNNDKKPDLVVGSQWHIFDDAHTGTDEKHGKFKKTKMQKDGSQLSIHLNRSTKNKIAFAKPTWPVPVRNAKYCLPSG